MGQVSTGPPWRPAARSVKPGPSFRELANHLVKQVVNRVYTLLSVAVYFGGDAGTGRAHEGGDALGAMRPKATGFRNQVCSILYSFRAGPPVVIALCSFARIT